MFLSYFLLRSPRPESVTLARDVMRYDPGGLSPISLMNPWYAMRHADPNEVIRKVFSRRRTIEVGKHELKDLVLARVGERQWLTFDRGADRIEIGEHLREPEREWLAEVIRRWKEAP